ncbi:hypothetical protein TIFTF001_034870 [Ficus carica]|uniref:Uncharacterized protein n=1 Tax=Ficus carica TaxID=3494 RepID=A0AA88E162_FICCA|nr:hypothetical protein TIFTF001_034828 [Ficus carica]GMN65767.1 hypothetical protein TIFTF001_034836 [Ficus carica]GMN65798.1 hypothetical protein TIFTF001_034863 [Ficus carica]GMN65801.1 hypothetical protein TIFTF001_034870 [Ficus carica]
MAARQGTYTYVMLIVVFAERKLTTYVYAVGPKFPRLKLDVKPRLKFKVGLYRVSIRAKGSCLPVSQYAYLRHSHSHLQVPLASRCVALDARLWWRTIREPAILGGSWEEFRALTIARYGPLPDKDAVMPYRDPEIYNDMNFERYLNYVTDWHAYPKESMGHYCRRFQEAMLPHIPDIGSSEMRALQLLRNGLPPEVKEFVQAPMVGMTLENMINDIMEAELIAHVLQADALVNDHGQVPVDDEIPPKEVEVGADVDNMDSEDFPNNPEPPKDPPAINIESDDKEDVEEYIEDFEDDPEEILFGDEDWDVFSDETNQLREQVAQLNQIPQTNKVPPQNNPVPPVAPQVPEVRQEVSLAPTELQRNPPLVREDLLYERFRQMKALEFEGLTDPIEADNWLIDIQVILDFMGHTEQEKVLCASFALKKDARHWEILAAQQDEFTSFKQGSMSVLEAIKKFEQLARLCPELVPNETEKVRRMMKMFRTDIAKQVSARSSPPTLVANCICRVLRA